MGHFANTFTIHSFIEFKWAIILPFFLEPGNAAAIKAVVGRLADADSRVRLAAVDALAKITERGNAVAIKAVAGRLEDADRDVRIAAIAVLATIAEQGNAMRMIMDREMP